MIEHNQSIQLLWAVALLYVMCKGRGPAMVHKRKNMTQPPSWVKRKSWKW